MLEVDERQVVELVRAAVRRQQVVGDQGVARDTGELDAVAAEHLEVELQVLAGLLDRRVLEDRPERAAHRLPVELGLAGGVADRHVPCDHLVAAEGESDQLRDHRIERGGLGVEGEAGRRREHRPEILEIGRGGHQPVGAAVDVGHLAAEVAQQAAELELAEQGAGAVGRRREAQRELVEGDGDRRVGADGREVLRQVGAVALLGELGAGRRRGDLVDVGVDVVEALPGRQQRLHALLADALDAGDVVRRVAPDAEGVGHQRRRAAELRLDLGQSDPALVHRVVDRDVVGDQLHQVLVRADQDHVE